MSIEQYSTGSGLYSGIRKIDLKKTKAYSSRESSVKKSPDPGTRRIPESAEDSS